MDDLQARHCTAVVERLPDGDAERSLGRLDGWRIEDGLLCKTYTFKSYHATMSFVNLVAWIAQRENHHPELHVGYGRCRVEYSTHSVGGLSANDFICAARIDAILDA